MRTGMLTNDLQEHHEQMQRDIFVLSQKHEEMLQFRQSMEDEMRVNYEKQLEKHKQDMEELQKKISKLEQTNASLESKVKQSQNETKEWKDKAISLYKRYILC
jgi:chromosome segregation ATPase